MEKMNNFGWVIDDFVGETNDELELLTMLCKELINKHSKYEARLQLSQFSDFSVVVPIDRSRMDEDTTMNISLNKDFGEEVRSMIDITRRMYGDDVLSFHPFIIALLHELGHINTIDAFDDALITNDLLSYEMNGPNPWDYKHLLHEKAADEWCWHHFIPNNWDYVQELQAKIVPLLETIYSQQDDLFSW